MYDLTIQNCVLNYTLTFKNYFIAAVSSLDLTLPISLPRPPSLFPDKKFPVAYVALSLLDIDFYKYRC